MPGRHSLVSEKALNALNSPVGRSTAVALAAGTILGFAIPAANAEDASVANLAPVSEPLAQGTGQGTAAVTASSDAAWSFEQVEAESGIVVSEETKQAIAAEANRASTARNTRATSQNQNAGTAQAAAASSETAAASEAPAASSSSSTGSAVLATALSYAGAPYMWGGTTPSGWDCIGFVRYVYAKHGVSIGGSTSSVLSAGRRVAYSEAQPGDILYWPGHVAIYAGNGKNIGAWNASMDTTVGPNSWVGGTPVVIRVLG